MEPEMKVERVEDLQGLIFDPTLDAGIELQKHIAALFDERAAARARIVVLEAALKRVAKADSWNSVSALRAIAVVALLQPKEPTT